MTASPPTGTVTFLFTDIEGSTRSWDAHRDAMARAVAGHDALLRGAIAAHRGHVFKTVGDAFCAAFQSAGDALAAAVAVQRSLAAREWPEVGALRVRAALHTGVAEERDADYFGPTVNRVARLLAAGHGGQTLLSRAATEAVALAGALADGLDLRDLGDRRLRDLTAPERVSQLLVSGLPDAFPPLNSLDARPNNLPAQPTPLLGREADLAVLKARLREPATRLLTLTGPGGTGKTRLALQAAADLIDDFPHGVWFVDLSATVEPGLVAAEIAGALGVREEGGGSPEAQVLAHLADRELLLVLDNFEQVLPAAELVGRLVAGCPRLTLLVTSRAPLRATGEREHPVEPLPVPNLRRPVDAGRLEAFPSVELFVERAAAVKPGFALSAENARAVAEICVALDGLPLAIELAAARTRLLTPQAMLPRLEGRLKLLTGGARDRAARQQTLRGAIAWSHDLLAAEERALFARLSVFAGGCTFDAAEAVANAEGDLDLLDGLDALVQHSLLRQEETSEGEPRVRMLATLREFGLEQLDASGETATIVRRHADYFTSLLGEAERDLLGEEQGAALDRLERELENLRAAIGWMTASGEPERVLTLSSGLQRFAVQRGRRTELRTWLERALAAYDGPAPEPRASALTVLGNIANLLDDYAGARDYYERAHSIWTAAGKRLNAAVSAYGLASLARSHGNLVEARDRFAAALEEFRAADDKEAQAFTLDQLGELARLGGDHPAARNFHREALRLVETLGNPASLAFSYHALGRLALDEGDEAEAERLLGESRRLYEAVDDRWGVATALHAHALLSMRRGQWSEASAFETRALVIRHELEDQVGVVECLEGLAHIAHFHDAADRSVRLLACAAHHRESMRAPAPTAEQDMHDRVLAVLRDRVDEPIFSAAWSAGSAITVADAVAEVLSDSTRLTD